MTLKEVMQALLAGKPVKKSWYNGTKKSDCILELNHRGEITDTGGGYRLLERSCNYEIYTPKPPKKIKKWQWRYHNKWGSWIVENLLLTEYEAANKFPINKHEKHAGPFEVDEL